MHIPFWHNDDILVSELQIEVEDTFIASILANLPFSIGIVKMIVAPGLPQDWTSPERWVFWFIEFLMMIV